MAYRAHRASLYALLAGGDDAAVGWRSVVAAASWRHADRVPLAKQLLSAVGSWHGTNAFRLMPTDEPYSAPATADVTAEPADAISLRYSWVHPDDGEQRGLLVLADAGDGNVAALWLDTWHQPAAQTAVSKAPPDGSAGLEYVYADVWRWQVEVRAEPELTVTMRNVVPADIGGKGHAGPYDAMRMTFQRRTAS